MPPTDRRSPIRSSTMAPQPAQGEQSTDPLAAIEGGVPTGGALHDLWTRWLAAELVDDQYARLDQAGSTPETGIPLARVFIDVASAHGGPYGDEPDEAGDAVLSAEEVTPSAPAPGLLANLLAVIPLARSELAQRLPSLGDLQRPGPRARSHGSLARLLVIGGPGQGKSTLGQYLCQLHRIELLRQRTALLTAGQQQALTLGLERAASDGLPKPRIPALPLRIILRDFAAWMFKTQTDLRDALVGFVADRMTRSLGTAVAPETVRAALTRIPWLLVIDGLDEVPVSAGRAEILDAVRALLDSECAETPHLVLATTRPQGYAGELGDFASHTLLGLSRARAMTYASRLMEARYPGQSARRVEILERLIWAWNEPTSRRLMRTPLQVSILAALVAQIGRAPADRWRLFSDYYRVMYQREVERPNLKQAELLRNGRRYIDEVHRLAGLWLQVRSEQPGQTDALLERAELAQLMETVLERNGHEEAYERQVLVEEIFEAAVERLVFLVHAEDGKFGFEIRSLQELMAAEALLTGGDAEVALRLRHIAPLDAWRNVFLFAAGKCFAETWHLAPVIVNEICPWLNDGIDDPAVKGCLTGSELALDLLEDGAARNQPKLARPLSVLALRLLELPPSPIHARLAVIAMTNFEAPFRQAIEARLSLPEAGQRLAAWSVLAVVADAGISWAVTAAGDHWPGEGQARRDIVTACNVADEPAGAWLQAQMANSLEDFPPSFMRGVRFDRLEDTPLAWWVSALSDEELLTRHSRTLVLDDQADTIGLELYFNSLRNSDWPLPPSTSLATAPPSWLPLVLAAHFAEDPSPGRLATALRTLADVYDAEAFDSLRSSLPWPLAQALGEARSAEELRSLANRVDAGECGDRDTWEEAERQWRTRISLEWLLEVESGWPRRDRPGRAFPFAAVTASTSSVAKWTRRNIDRAVAAYRHAPAEQKRPLAHLIDHLLYSRWFSRRAPGALEPTEIRAIWNEVGHPLRPFSIVALVPEAAASDAWIELANDVGRVAAPKRWVPDNGNMAALTATWYAQSPELQGLLRLLAIYLPWSPAIFRISVPPRLLDLGRFPAGSPSRFHAALVRLGQMGTAVDVVKLATAIADAVPTDPVEAGMADDYIDSTSILERNKWISSSFLAELVARLPAHAWRLAGIAVDTLRQHRQERKSALEDAATWNRLNLPMPHPASRRPSSPAPAAGVFRFLSASFSSLRPFDQLEVAPPSGPTEEGQWLVFIGENGVGKTTLLRGLAFALAETSAAAGALAHTTVPYRGSLGADAKIEIRTAERTFLATIGVDSETGRETLVREPKNGGHRPFLVAYGCRRGSALGGAARAVSFNPYEEVATLFEEGASLIHAETWLKERALAATETESGPAKLLFEAILKALPQVLPGIELIDVKADRVWVEGPAVGRTPLEGLSDGYIATMGWIIDLIARWVAHKERAREPIASSFFEEMEGVVLLDELDLHLHPRWQVRVIDDLRRLFPRMTFVVTTHNPLTLLGARPGEVIVLRRSDLEAETDDAGPPGSRQERSRIEVFQEDIPPGMTLDQVVTGAWFGLASTLDKGTLHLLEQHRLLLRAGARRDDPQRSRLETELRRRLGGFADTSLERIAQGVAAELLPTSARDLRPDEREELRRRILKAVAANAAASTAGTVGRSGSQS